MSKIVMYSTRYCLYCDMAERLLQRKGAGVEKILIDENPDARREMMEMTDRRSVPQIFINGRHVGGYDDLKQLDESGMLTTLLQATSP